MRATSRASGPSYFLELPVRQEIGGGRVGQQFTRQGARPAAVRRHRERAFDQIARMTGAERDAARTQVLGDVGRERRIGRNRLPAAVVLKDVDELLRDRGFGAELVLDAPA